MGIYRYVDEWMDTGGNEKKKQIKQREKETNDNNKMKINISLLINFTLTF